MQIRCHTRNFLLLLLSVLLILNGMSLGQGKVYLVIGSDTAIWDGMNVARYNNYYHPGLYTNPSRQGYGVMDPAFRNQLVDSYGTPMKLTWWMMTGSIFRPGTNTNVPYANIITMYLMKKYHQNSIDLFGDELTLHYHTFKWTDYDGDGRFWWNQTLTFDELRDDFDFNLAQLLIEEEVFPVSFRSGWHYMDNSWQARLDELLPYSLHNDWPSKRTDTSEPLDNTFDWSRASGQFVPYRPHPVNYQVPGPGPGWNVRSTHLNTARFLDLVDSIFARAYNGADQLACIWGHLPEVDFLSNLMIIDSLAHRMSNQYPGVTFRYCTAIEAFQRWQGMPDTTAPVLTFEKIESGQQVTFRITTDEQIFQPQPFVAYKDIYEDFRQLACQQVGTNVWETIEPVDKALAARAAVAVCDTLGNQSFAFINFRPEDVFVDNEDDGYSEISGSWQTVDADVWGTDYRSTSATAGTATVGWTFVPEADGLYNIETRLPDIPDPSDQLTFQVLSNGAGLDTIHFDAALPAEVWNHITTVDLTAGSTVSLQMTGSGNLAADVVKFSALVRDRDIRAVPDLLDFGEVVINDSSWQTLRIENRGIEPLTISAITSVFGLSGIDNGLPAIIPATGHSDFDVFVLPSELGVLFDTLKISSNDPGKPQIAIPLSGNVQNTFIIIDNEDSLHYSEQGNWSFSNAQAYGPSSRYAPLNAGASATFTTSPEEAGIYDIYQIVPSTVNGADNALYLFSLEGIVLDSLFVDQNAGSGDWVRLARHYLPANVTVDVSVIDAGGSTGGGSVLRADAVKLALVETVSDVIQDDRTTIPQRFEFEQNFPNPFNAATRFRYALAGRQQVRLQVFNNLGQLVISLVNREQAAGRYDVSWQADDLASGIYFARFQAGSFVKTRKLMLVK